LRLLAVSDVHVSHAANRAVIEALSPHPSDWLILGGDIGETYDHLRWTLDSVRDKFAQLIWVPGNHELWTMGDSARGQEKYDAMVAVCKERSVITPEDPYPMWNGDGGPCVIAPLFLLYDYSLRPEDVPLEGAVAWATEDNRPMCADETYLRPDPFPSRQAWCNARCDDAEARLMAIDPEMPTVLVNHFPLRSEHAFLPLLPRFSIWCGTSRTEDWHQRFRARAVVFGHCHMRSTRWRDGIRFEEVSLGYPKQWNAERSADSFLREILPGPSVVESDGTAVRR
jgi:predicted phosphodiesterase